MDNEGEEEDDEDGKDEVEDKKGMRWRGKRGVRGNVGFLSGRLDGSIAEIRFPALHVISKFWLAV